MAKIVPAILTDNEDDYHKRLLMAEHVSDLIQIDMIDGMFADNKTVVTDIIKKYLSSSMLEIHLMVNYPQNYIDDLMFVEHVWRIIVPFERDPGLPEVIYHIKNHNKQVGISLELGTPVRAIIHLLDRVDLLLLMAVESGYAGQEFQERVIDKVREAKKLVPGLVVSVDGGVNFENAARLALAGADFLVANSVLYDAPDFHAAYEKLSKLASQGLPLRG